MTPVLYGFYRAPPLDVTQTWSETLYVSVKPESHEELVYFLNEGSQINIFTQCVNPILFVTHSSKGVEEMAEWIEDPSYPDVTLSWNVVHGNGTIVQDICKSNNYYVAVGNLNSEGVKLDILRSCSTSW